MVYWRGLLRRQCPNCKQLLHPKIGMVQQIAQRNARERRLCVMLGRKPRQQICGRCHKVVFEGEIGFEWNMQLLIDCNAKQLVEQTAVASA